MKGIIGITGQILVGASSALSPVSMLNFLKISVLCLCKRVFLGDEESSKYLGGKDHTVCSLFSRILQKKCAANEMKHYPGLR